MNAVPDATIYQKRQSQLAKNLQAEGLAALVLNPGPSLIYLTGLHFHLMERPVLAFFAPQAPPVLVIPELEAAKTSNLAYPSRSFLYGEDPGTWQQVFDQAVAVTGLTSKTQIGVEPNRMRLLEAGYLRASLPDISLVPADASLAAMRMRKDAQEIEAMRQAVRIAQEALQRALDSFQLGMTEKELAAELTLQLLRGGSETEFPFTPIVSAGPNSANPHATPSNRPIQSGDLLVIDWGATYQGYVSDITRTFAIGSIDPEFARIAEVVAQANAAGRAAVGPEVHAQAVDAAARQVIEAAGYGEYFTHRTGHGIGMEGHEGPYIRSGNEQPLLPGMTFTIEPGIYLPDRNGVRIEDNVVITATGCECLTDLPRELVTLGVK